MVGFGCGVMLVDKHPKMALQWATTPLRSGEKMFGLMRQRGCTGDLAERQRRRLHYCGTCKTLGARHGQLSRALLNHDTVFLAELLDALASPGHWDPAYQSYNCLRLPTRADDQPPALRLAAAVTVVMAGFKLQDRVEDRGGGHWQLAWRGFRDRFHKAREELTELGVAVDELDHWLAGQHRREAEAGALYREKGAEAALAWVAEPTARATGLVLARGMALVGRPELAVAGEQLGRRFGTLIYLLDAWEDYADDQRRREFNALGLIHGHPAALSGQAAVDCRARLWRLATALEADLATLPLPTNLQASFQARLQGNLAQRLGERGTCDCLGLPQAGRHQRAIAVIRGVLAPPAGGAVAQLRWWAMALSLLPLAMAVPREVEAAGSYRACLGLSMNLMVLGAVVAWLGQGLRGLAMSASGGRDEDDDRNRRRKRRNQHDAGEASADCCCDCCGDLPCCSPRCCCPGRGRTGSGGGCCDNDGGCCGCDGCDCCSS